MYSDYNIIITSIIVVYIIKENKTFIFFIGRQLLTKDVSVYFE